MTRVKRVATSLLLAISAWGAMAGGAYATGEIKSGVVAVPRGGAQPLQTPAGPGEQKYRQSNGVGDAGSWKERPTKGEGVERTRPPRREQTPD